MSKSMMAANPPLRSLNNDVPSYVSFFNRSYRAVNLFWINYEGKLLRYARLPPLKGTAMNTYVTHPWIVRDAHTGYPLLMNGKPVFHPPTDTHEEARALIWIHIPDNLQTQKTSARVFSLLRRALEIIFIHYDMKTVMKWDMPVTLKELLKKIAPITEFGNYRFFEDVSYYDLQQLGFEADMADEADEESSDDAESEDDNDDDEDGGGGDNDGGAAGAAGDNEYDDRHADENDDNYGSDYDGDEDDGTSDDDNVDDGSGAAGGGNGDSYSKECVHNIENNANDRNDKDTNESGRP